MCPCHAHTNYTHFRSTWLWKWVTQRTSDSCTTLFWHVQSLAFGHYDAAMPVLLDKTQSFMPFVFEPHFPMWPKFPISKYPAEKNEYWLFPLLLASSLPCCRRIFAAHRHHHYASLWTTYGELSWIYPVKTRSTSDLIVMAQWANTLMDHDFYPHIAWGYVSLRIFLYDAYFQLAGTENVHPLSKKSSLSKCLLQSNDMAF